MSRLLHGFEGIVAVVQTDAHGTPTRVDNTPVTDAGLCHREWIGVLAGEPQRDVWTVRVGTRLGELHHLTYPTDTDEAEATDETPALEVRGRGVAADAVAGLRPTPRSVSAFVHLHTHSAFSFGDGASGVESLVLRAACLGMPALALTDTMSLSGIPALVRRCARAGLTPLGGCEIAMAGGGHLTLLMDGPAGFATLSRLLSAAWGRAPKRQGARVTWADLEEGVDGLVCLTGAGRAGLLPGLVRRNQHETLPGTLGRLEALFGRGQVFVEVTRTQAEGEAALANTLLAIADTCGLPAIATNAVRHVRKTDFAAHETLRRIALHLGPGDESGELPLNGEAYLKSGAAMDALFADRPDVLHNTYTLAARLAPPLDPAARHLPRYPRLPPGESSFSYLSGLAWQGALSRYGTHHAPATDRLCHELEVIRDLGYCDYFLICQDVCDEARRREVGFALRGSAVGSAVAYCLGLSPHDPLARRISFERFLSKARQKPPDIDIDFRHDARDGIMAYTRATYGPDKVAGVANYVTWRGRSLVRDVGRVLGVAGGAIDRLRELLWHSRGDDLAEKLVTQPELVALGIPPDLYADLFALCATLAGLPRHLGTHSSGLVVSDVPLAGVCPVVWAAKGVLITALDKDDVEAPGVGLLKMDQLCLRALTAVDLATQTIRESDPAFDYDGRDREDGATLAMIRQAQTVGVFQLESPAQQALQWRLQADRFDDLIASVALIRPGPLVGKTVEPYISTRRGWVSPTYPLPEMEPVLRETYGRILFQDQVLEVVTVVGDYTRDEADRWLKTMTHARSEPAMHALGQELLARARPKGLTGRRFERLWKQIKGFARYGFCEGHAVAFASHAQGTAYLLCHHPAAFLSGVLSVEPCGFWPVATLTAEANRRGVATLGPCLNRSAARVWQGGQGEETNTIRCPLGFVAGVSAGAADAIVAERERGGLFGSLAEAGQRLGFVGRDALEGLTLAGALDSVSPSRRQTLWSLPALHRPPGSLRERRVVVYAASPVTGQQALGLPLTPLIPDVVGDFTSRERFVREWQTLGFSPTFGHPMGFYRGEAEAQGVLACAALQECKPGEVVTLGGLCLRPHRPPTPSGQVFVFLTLEDETGLAQVTVPPDVYAVFGAQLFGHAFLRVTGQVEARGVGKILHASEVAPLDFALF